MKHLELKSQTPPPTPPLEGRGVSLPQPFQRRGGTPPDLPKGEEWLAHCPTGMTAQLLPSLQGEGLGVGSVTSSPGIIN